MADLTGVDVEPGTVVPAINLGYLVASRSTRGAWWLVTNTGCSCPADTARCWHSRQVEAHVKALDAKHKRPSMPPNVSALVD